MELKDMVNKNFVAGTVLTVEEKKETN